MNSETVRQTIARKVAEHRKRKGLTQEELAQAMSQLGFETGRLSVLRIEGGKRDVSIDELIVLAAVLDVPPLLLMLPLGDGPLFRVGDDELHPEYVRKWFFGQQPFGRSSSDNPRSVFAHGDHGLWRENAWPLRAFETLADLTQKASRAESALVTALTREGAITSQGDAPIPVRDLFDLSAMAPQAVVDQFEGALRVLGEHVRLMRQRGLVVSDLLLAEGWAGEMARLGVDVEPTP